MSEISKINFNEVLYAIKDTTTPTSAELGDNAVVSFKNSAGITVFTLDLSDLETDTNTYGNIVLSTNSLEIVEGTTGTFTVKLESAPSVNQVVYLAVSDSSKLSVSVNTLTFTPQNYNTPQTVTVSALNDLDSDAETETITLTSRKVSAKQLSVSIEDNDYQIVTDGLTLYFDFRNGSLVDSVGNITATNGGTLVDNGVCLEDSTEKLEFTYPVTTNIPNGFTIDMDITGFGHLNASGTGFGNGYAYRANWGSYNISYGGFAYKLQDDSISSSQISYTAPDWLEENIITVVYKTDGSVKVFNNGIQIGSRTAVTNFANYNVSGNMAFKIPYTVDGQFPVTVSELRFYERALTDSEVVQNYHATVSHQQVVNF